MTIYTRLIAVFVLCWFTLTVSSQAPGYKTFRLEKDNKTIRINCVYKNGNGYLLIGSNNGLYKFDGEKYYSVPFSNPEYTDTVTAIFEDNTKKTWVGFKSGRIAHIINKKLVYFNPEEGTPKKKITGFLQDKNNNIWFATAGEGIYYISKNHLYLLDEANGMSDLNINAIALTENGDILAGTDQGINICYVQQGKKILNIGTNAGLPDYFITSIMPAGKNRFWIGFEDKGFCLYDHNSGKITIPEAAKNWNNGPINALLPQRNAIWIGTGNNGVYAYNVSTDRIDSIKGIPAFTKVNGLISDNQGNNWIASPDFGMLRTPGGTLNIIEIPESPVFEHIHTLLGEKNGNIWLNDIQNKVLRLTFENGKTNLHSISLPGVTEKTDITALYQDNNGNIWVGTMGKGLFIIDPITLRFRAFTDNKVFDNAGILSVSGAGNTVFVSSLQGSMEINLQPENKDIQAPIQFSNFDNANTGTNYIYSIFKDSRNRTWFATDGNGLTMKQDNTFTYYHEKNQIKDDHVYSVTEDKKGNIWFSTATAGIYKFDGNKFTNYSTREGLSDLGISVLKTDRAGNIIIIHKKGLDILDPATGNISYLSSSQGIGTVNAEDLGAVSQDSAGNIMVSTTKGILTYALPLGSVQKPKAIIESVQLFLNDIDDDHSGRYSYNENNFTFNYTGLYYTDPEKVFYQYKLEGLDTSWVITRDRSKNFPKLDPGKYRFRIQASLNKNFKNADEASYEFVIAKPFYAEFWFYLLCLSAAGGLLYWYIKSREASLKKMERLRQEKIQVQFEVLRTQVNPHFLFNSFNTLISTIEENPDMAVAYAEQLSDFFRDIINYRDKEIISLGEEIKLLNNYFQLQQKRYGKYLQLEVNISEQQCASYFIPPLTIQLLTENAIKHNMVSKDNILTITLEITDAELLLVKNNINPRLTKQAGAGMGLQNIVNRYNLLSNKKVSITDNGNYFIVSLPLLKN